MGSNTHEVETIDCTPTWETMMSVILRVWPKASEASKSEFRIEMLRCARIADQRNELAKELDELKSLWDEHLGERRSIAAAITPRSR